MPTFLFLEVSPSLTERSRSFLGFVLGPAFLHGQFSLGGCAAYTQRRDDNETADHSGSPWLTYTAQAYRRRSLWPRRIDPSAHPTNDPLDHDPDDLSPWSDIPHIQGPSPMDQRLQQCGLECKPDARGIVPHPKRPRPWMIRPNVGWS